MKVNKYTIIACVIMLIVSGIFVYRIQDTGDKLFILFVGIFTGVLVSLVSAIVNYLHQKNIIFNSVMTQIADIFVNTLIIHRMTGMIVEKTQTMTRLDDLNYKSILSLADLNIGFASSMNTKLYSPIIKGGSKNNAINEMMEFENDLMNLKFCIGKLQSYALEHDLLWMEMNNRQYSLEELNALQGKRHLVIVQTAKLHEYEASLLQKIDKIAAPFYCSKKSTWEERKKLLFAQADRILQQSK